MFARQIVMFIFKKINCLLNKLLIVIFSMYSNRLPHFYIFSNFKIISSKIDFVIFFPNCRILTVFDQSICHIFDNSTSLNYFLFSMFRSYENLVLPNFCTFFNFEIIQTKYSISCTLAKFLTLTFFQSV